MSSKKNYTLYLAIILTLFLTSFPIDAATIDGRFYPILTDSAIQSKSIDNLVGHFDHKINIVFSDIDGTLLPLNKTGPRGQVPESVKKSVIKLKDAKTPLILATGRASSEARQIAKNMGNEKTYIIAQQGAEIVDPNGKVIYEDNINNQESKKIIKEIESFNKLHNQDSKIFFFEKGQIYMFEKVNLPYILDEIKVIKSLDELPADFTLNKIGIYDPNSEKLKLIQAHLKKQFHNYHIDISADVYCDISTATSTKGNAVKKLAEILNVNLKNAAVFGDAENDVSMLKLVKTHKGLAIAVGNAMSSVKNSANFITSPVQEDGFAHAVDKILENNALMH